jgi:hypothetical protein
MARPLGSLSQSIADAFLRRPQTAEYHRHQNHAHSDPDELVLAQGPGQARQPSHAQAQAQAPAPPHDSHAGSGKPSRTEVLNYLGELAKDYHLPPKLVYAVADAESGIGPKMENHNPPVRDKKGRLVHPASTDYGLMQINDRTWIGKEIRDAHGQKFKITKDVENDWKANAREGIAILADSYHHVTLSEGPGATREDIALGTYSAYNHGATKWHKFLDKGPDGLPKDGANRNFANKYRQAPEK